MDPLPQAENHQAPSPLSDVTGTPDVTRTPTCGPLMTGSEVEPMRPWRVPTDGTDDALIAQLNVATGGRRVMVVAALGDSDGDDGPQALRAVLDETGPGLVDLRCAALVSLAKRCGPAATDVSVEW